VRDGELELRVLRPAPDGAMRMAVRLRRKNGPAPLRNRIRRILRDVLREHAQAMEPAWMLWTFPPSRLQIPTRDIRSKALDLMHRAGLLGDLP
jgi:ribonuclease P protein component